MEFEHYQSESEYDLSIGIDIMIMISDMIVVSETMKIEGYIELHSESAQYLLERFSFLYDNNMVHNLKSLLGAI